MKRKKHIHTERKTNKAVEKKKEGKEFLFYHSDL